MIPRDALELLAGENLRREMDARTFNRWDCWHRPVILVVRHSCGHIDRFAYGSEESAWAEAEEKAVCPCFWCRIGSTGEHMGSEK